jgi:hypothetical protein
MSPLNEKLIAIIIAFFREVKRKRTADSMRTCSCSWGVSVFRRSKLRGFYFKFAILIEMLIKGEDGFNVEALH